ncbi:MAG: hypothetical protein KF866_08210 [Phycisphaeraceae bacterium]|nr:hypothetical protein [Phycisphaeraceae bacterium]MCW5753860.1 hypothetical protein [Phycisphaeraceae bacterium]
MLSQDLMSQVEGTANRLRAIQADLADMDEQTRREHLEEELERAVSGIVGPERREFLAQLAARFPSWDSDISGVGSSAPVAAAAGGSGDDMREWRDHTKVLEQLIKLASKLPEEKRIAIRRELERAGLAGSGVGSWPEEPLGRLRGLLAGGPQGGPEPGRVLDMLTLLLELTVNLERVTWRTWAQLAPNSAVKRRGQLQRSAAHFVSGDDEVSRTQLQQELEKLRSLTAAVIMAMSKAGQAAYKWFENISPSRVEEYARMEGKSFGKSWPEKFWTKYEQLASNIDPATIEVQVMQAIAEHAEQLLRHGKM